MEILIGILSGIVSGIGMGGGTILILVLSLFMGIEQHTAQACNMVYFIPTSIVAIILSSKAKLVNFSVGIPLIISGIIGAGIGANIANFANSKNLKIYFGIFLSIIAIYEIFCYTKQYILKRKSHNKKQKEDNKNEVF